MTVYTFENNAFAIDFHDIAVHFEFTETNILRNDFHDIAISISYSENSFVEVWDVQHSKV